VDRSSPARGRQREEAPPLWVREQGREPGPGLGLGPRRHRREPGSEQQQERGSAPGRQQRAAAWEPAWERTLGAPQVRARGEPDRREVVTRLRVGTVAWVPRPRVGPPGPTREWAPGVQQGAPVRLAWPFLRLGTHPDRGGESASGSTSDPTRHNAYPGLPATPGQGNSHVSRETISQRRHSRAGRVRNRHSHSSARIGSR
jgi:hypothetical protein